MKLKIKNNLTDDKRIGYILFFTALCLRILYSLWFYFFQPSPLSNTYVEIANEILEQGTVFYKTSISHYDASGPIIPLLNAFTMLIFGRNYLGLYLVTAIGSALVTLFTYKTARLFLEKKVSLFIGLWSLFYFFYYLQTPGPGKDIWMSFLFIIIVYLILQNFILKQYNFKKFLALVIVLVISYHTDERYLVFGLVSYIILFFWETKGLKKFAFSKQIIFISLTGLLMLPWGIRNYYKFNKVILLTTRTEKFTDKLLGYSPKDEYFSDDFTAMKGRYYIDATQFDSVITGTKLTTDAGYPIREPQRKAMENGLLPKPLTGFKALFYRTVTMLEPFQIRARFESTGYYFYKKSLRNNLVTFFFYGILFIFSFYGFYAIWNKNKKIAMVFLGLMIPYLLLNIVLIPYALWRYRLPLDSLFIIAGCVGIYSFYNKMLVVKANDKVPK